MHLSVNKQNGAMKLMFIALEPELKMWQDNYLDDHNRELVPGVTPSPISPGVVKYPAGSPPPLVFGVSVPGGTVGQIQPSEPPAAGTAPFVTAPGSPTSLGIEYNQGYIKTLIGKRIRLVFLLGESIIQDRVGICEQVGIDYVILRDTENNSLLMCDAFSIKFVISP